MIRVVAKGKLKPGVKVEEYLKLAKELVIETNKENGCISYILMKISMIPLSITIFIFELLDKAR